MRDASESLSDGDRAGGRGPGEAVPAQCQLDRRTERTPRRAPTPRTRRYATPTHACNPTHRPPCAPPPPAPRLPCHPARAPALLPSISRWILIASKTSITYHHHKCSRPIRIHRSRSCMDVFTYKFYVVALD